MHNCPFFGKLFSNVYALTIDVVANYIYLLEPCCTLCYGPWLTGSGPRAGQYGRIVIIIKS